LGKHLLPKRLAASDAGAILPPADEDVAAAVPVERDERTAHRILHLGKLSALSGAADFFACAAAWADAHPRQRIEVTWIGGGDLQLVLQAQPLPQNFRAVFQEAPES